MKIFIDTANTDEISKANELGIIDGVTTNPTLIAKENRNFLEIIKEICSIVDGPVSVEAVSMQCDEMVKEAREFSKISSNIVVKIPLVEEGLKAVKILSREGISTNVTLCFSALQALLTAKAGATYISPFVGRLDDINHIGMELVRNIKTIYDNYNFTTQIIVASVRNPIHVLNASLMGTDIVTCPYNIILQFLKHPLTDIGIKRFLNDWEKVPKR